MSNLIKLPAVIKLTALSRSSLYSYIKNGEFPAPIKIGKRAVAWSEARIRDWIDQRVNAQ